MSAATASAPSICQAGGAHLGRPARPDSVDLVFSNAGVAGGGSFVKDSREEWERTFAINWWGVYFCARTFLPLLIASGDGVLVNMSSVAAEMYGPLIAQAQQSGTPQP